MAWYWIVLICLGCIAATAFITMGLIMLAFAKGLNW